MAAANFGAVYNAQEIERFIDGRFGGNQAVLQQKVDEAAVILGQCGDKMISAESVIVEVVAKIEDSDQRIAADIDLIHNARSAIEQLHAHVHAQVQAIESELVSQITTNEQQATVATSALGDGGVGRHRHLQVAAQGQVPGA